MIIFPQAKFRKKYEAGGNMEKDLREAIVKKTVVLALLAGMAFFSAFAIGTEFHLVHMGRIGIFTGIYGIMVAIQLK
jgi:hypothetical protein